nr:MAG TPA: hypothetical protein [Caudoviricetes sp.]
MSNLKMSVFLAVVWRAYYRLCRHRLFCLLVGVCQPRRCGIVVLPHM